ncbi:adenosylmethionine--8-amino-7-oxononanoate transaminase [Mycobacterium shimoidei]|uniref:adenosylmethionine--8-amino-7-oxononanoate transaminase n=1 Tax=Mycobacterium shimoidei TaxID=29313 RepID=UPI0008495757|nr:adenosylmethionine--8-amino-7-oxononanoate transaminase [Mycobacterium shimoidei]MCV7260330.1 adenosylmethionine--8-amino-7-oxononanoate transaminase [Mycobacterium shimoidei]ODR12593.1 adenosylmethionine--8-amino-7-oxononanoate transaminase [Mycobacterium shimoidei]ORW82175.1 adenosylmethionine-8-amino-7-oxononanoate aminotransferase [Mycobacterium shimoidei]
MALSAPEPTPGPVSGSASGLTPEQISAIDAAHLWHPYSTIGAESVAPVVAVGARGAWLTLVRDGQSIEVLDAMSSWWTAIHGHGHPVLDRALAAQLDTMNHVMFGGLTHEPAARLAQLLVEISPAGLETVFFCDSGSVSVEVAVKMALQYWRSRGQYGKRRLMTWRGGYHGDTFTPMSICDPDGGMHALWTDVLASQVFAPQVPHDYDAAYSEQFEAQLAEHAAELAAVVVEPVVQGAGGMRFHDPSYLRDLREICTRHDVLLVFDEIATGFGRTGELFAADHAGVSPDIMCVGKALTGGYLSLAATLCTVDIARTISSGAAGALMHGPTFMANPLACAVSVASVELLLGQDWRSRVAAINAGLAAGLRPARELPAVTDVRVRGAIGVIECDRPVDLAVATPAALDRGVWLRPFRNLVYAMPPFICTPDEIAQVTSAMVDVAELTGSRRL